MTWSPGRIIDMPLWSGYLWIFADDDQIMFRSPTKSSIIDDHTRYLNAGKHPQQILWWQKLKGFNAHVRQSQNAN